MDVIMGNYYSDENHAEKERVMLEMTETLEKLSAGFKDVMPLLNQNLGLTYDAYMKEGLAHGAYMHVLKRHSLATMLTNLGIDEVRETLLKPDTKAEDCFALGAGAFIDLKTMVKDLTGDDKIAAEEKVQALLQLYRDNGFTAQHPLLKIPVQPKNDA